MSAEWWRSGNLAGLFERWERQAAGDALPDPPATLLRLPSPARTRAAHSRSPFVVRPAAHLDCLNAGLAIGTPGRRSDLIRLSRARSVNLRLRRFAPRPQPVEEEETPEEDQEQGRVPPGPLLPRGDDLAWRLAALLQPPPETLLRSQGPLQWPAELFPYQRSGIRVLLQSPQLLLGDDMGLGKTVQAIAALRVLLMRGEIERALVVVPASLLEQWRRELVRWAPEVRVMVVHGPAEARLWQWQYRAHVTLTSYETLRSDYTGSPSCGPCREEWGLVILDEAQRVKNPESDVSRACKRLPRRRSWALTGTPLENRPEDVLSILEFATGGKVRPSLLASGPSLPALLGEYQLRRRKADVLHDLPPKLVTDLTLPLAPAQRRAYDRAESEGIITLREADEVRVEHVFALIARLKQICNFAPSGGSAKLEDLAGRVEELAEAGQKALVFTQYAGDESGARRIAAGLQQFAPLVYTGDLSPQARSRIVDRFNDEDACKVLVLSLKAGGLGLNLQRASYVFHFDRWWNPAVERQAEDRTHRLGQVLPVHVYRYIALDTIEQRIDDVLKQKARLFDDLVDGASLDLSRLLDRRDLFGLVGL